MSQKVTRRFYKRLLSLVTVSIFCLSQSTSALAFWSFPKPIPGESQSIPVAGSTVLIKGLTNQANQAFVNGREIFIADDGSFNQELIIPLGQTEVVVKVVDPEGNTQEMRQMVEAKENYFFGTGIADSTFNFSDSGLLTVVERDDNTFRDGFEWDGKVSGYATAKLKGQFKFKAAFDSDKDTGDEMFTYIDPDQYFPIYGDNSTVVYDVNSQGKAYALFEWDKSGAVFGNYQTQIGNDEGAQLLNYQRTLYGGKIHFETPKRTIYGEPVHKTTLFWAESNQNRGHSEFFATGGSLYYLRHRKILEGSEQIRIEVRDKQTGRAIHSISQRHNVDYEMKYEEGRVLFKKPVLSTVGSDTIISNSILEGNPVYIVANYEYEDQDTFPIVLPNIDDQTGGVRVSQHWGDHLRTGFTYVQEEKTGEHFEMLGGDVTLKIGNFTKIEAEIAHTKADTVTSFTTYNGGLDYVASTVANADDGSAARIEVNSAIGEFLGKEQGYLDVSGFWQRVDKDFAATDSLFEAGTRKMGLDISHQMNEKNKVRALFEQGWDERNSVNPTVVNQLQADRVDRLVAQWEHRYNDAWLFLSEYGYQRRRGVLNPDILPEGNESQHVIAQQVTHDFNERTSVFLGHQLGLNDFNESFLTAGVSTEILENFAIHARAAAGPKGNSVSAGFSQQVSANTSMYANWTIANTATDGKTSTTSFGSNTKIGEKGELRREKQFITSDERGHYKGELMGYKNKITPEFMVDVTAQRRDERNNDPAFTAPSAQDAYTGTVSYVKPDKFKAYTKLEYRNNTDNVWQVVSDTQGELKLTQDLFFYGEYEYSQSKAEETLIDKKQAGIAYRPVDFDWLNMLFKYTHLKDHRPQTLGSADGGFLTTRSNSDVLALEVALDLPWHFQYVQKIAFKDEDILAINPTATIQTPDDIEALLTVHRLNFHLTNKIDVASEWRRLRQKGATISERESGALVEFTYQILENIGLGAGFNFTSFKDDLTSPTKDSAKGFFLRAQGKY